MNAHERRKLNRLVEKKAETIAARGKGPRGQPKLEAQTEHTIEIQPKPNKEGKNRKTEADGAWHIAKRIAEVSATTVALLGAILGIMTGYFAMLPRVSVSQNEALDPSAIFSSPFIISNDGPLPLEDVWFRCGIAEAKISNGPEILGAPHFGTSFWVLKDKNGNTAPPIIGSPEMLPGERSTIPGCQFPWLNPMQHADIGIIVSFRVGYTPIHQTRTFQFVTLADSTGKLHWFPIPVK